MPKNKETIPKIKKQEPIVAKLSLPGMNHILLQNHHIDLQLGAGSIRTGIDASHKAGEICPTL
jgi:hypothetical protein